MLCDMLMQLIDLETQVRSGLRVESWTKLYNLVETMLYTCFFFLEWNKRRGQGVFLGGTSRLSAHNNPLQMTLRGLTFEQSQDVSKQETKPVFFFSFSVLLTLISVSPFYFRLQPDLSQHTKHWSVKTCLFHLTALTFFNVICAFFSTANNGKTITKEEKKS